MIKYLHIIILLFGVINITLAQTQNPNRVFAPYSQGNLGYLNEDHYSKNFGMANTGIAQYHQNSVNLKNPALLSYNKFTILETDLSFRTDQFSADTNVKRSNNANFNGVYLVMPISYKWSTALSLLPMSSTAFGARTTSGIAGTAGDSIIQNDTSYGGIQHIRWSNGFSVAKGLNIGASASYYFGNITKSKGTEIISSSNSQIINEIESARYRGFGLNFGASYHKKLKLSNADPKSSNKKDTLFTIAGKSNKDLVRKKELPENAIVKDTIINTIYGKNDREFEFGLGATFGMPGNWNKRTIGVVTNDFFAAIDTNESIVSTPMQMAFGVNFGNTSTKMNWSLALDYEITNWSNYSVDGVKQNGQNSSKLSVGLILTPEVQAEKFFKKSSYSVGAYHHKTPYLHNNTQLEEFGMHFGISFVDRAKRSNESYRWREKTKDRLNALSRYNVGVAVGTLGGNQASAIKQSFIKINLGIALNSEWFIRRKIN